MIVMPYRFALLLAFAGLSGLVSAGAFLACSSDPAADGAECSSNGDCNSGICQAGACAGRVCACSGPTCAKECDDGWVCSARGPVPGLSCVHSCNDNSACPSGTHCSDGLCVSGKDVVLSWVSKPGDTKCRTTALCRYEVRASGDGAGDVKSYAWTVNDAGVADKTEAVLEYGYVTAGTYPVHVTALLGDGRNGPSLDAVEVVCSSDPDFECTPGGDDCCTGTCTVAKRCR